MTNTTPYQAVNFVNDRLSEVGLPGIRHQMGYNYTTGRLNADKTPYWGYTLENGVDLEALSEWVEKYIAKKAAKVEAAPADPEQAEFDLAEAN